MHPISHQPVRRAGGFTMIETMIGVGILGLLLAVGLPKMSVWIQSGRAVSANEFYVDGFRQARDAALSHNSASRLVLTTNASNQQLDWRVDICYPTSAVVCNDNAGDWSTTAAPAGNDPMGVGGFKSVFRSANALPGTGTVSVAVSPAAASKLYFTPMGWVDTTFNPRVERIDVAPAASSSVNFPKVALVVTLAGSTNKCNPDIAAPGDPRKCP